MDQQVFEEAYKLSNIDQIPSYNDFFKFLKNLDAVSFNKFFYTLKDKLQNKFPRQRDGQLIFNIMFILLPCVADRLRGTKYDPFYVNDAYKIDVFLNEGFKLLQTINITKQQEQQ